MQSDCFAWRFLCGVAGGCQGQNSASADIDWNSIQRCFRENGLAAHVPFTRPKVKPDIVGQIDAAGWAPGFQYWSN